jgi:hypothetical protein
MYDVSKSFFVHFQEVKTKMWTSDATFGQNFASWWRRKGFWMLCKGAFVERMGLYVIFRQICSSMLPTHKILKLFYFPL